MTTGKWKVENRLQEMEQEFGLDPAPAGRDEAPDSWDVLAEARAQGAFDAATLTEVEAFLNAPREWQESRKS